MKIQLSMRGGIYGSLEFEPLDPRLIDPEFGNQVFAVLDEYELSARTRSRVAKTGKPDVRTERQTISFKVIPDVGEPKVYSIDEVSLGANPRLKWLFDTLWKHSRPRPAE